MSCLDTNTVAKFVEGRLSPDEVELVERHLDQCSACRRLVSEVAKLGPERSTEPPPTNTSPEHSVLADSEHLAPGTLVGRYVVAEVLGVGGMGIVYSARDPELKRTVALKLLRSLGREAPGTLQQRLVREAQAIAQISHPNVVNVFDVGSFGDDVFVAMELVQGVAASQWLRQSSRAWREVLQVFVQAGRGLAAAHEAGLVHRDFKPDNILIGQDGRVRVTDFGLARTLYDADESRSAVNGHDPAALDGASLTRTGTVLGTPAYMAPEQHRSAPADSRTDQFCFCVSLYEALYGQRPFCGASLAELADAAANGHINTPPAGRRVPTWLRQVVVQGLASNPSRRFSCMEELLGELSKDRARIARRVTQGFAIGVPVVVALVVSLSNFGDGTQLCEHSDRHMKQTWHQERKSAVLAAFVHTDRPYAEASFRSVARIVDAYTESWISMRTDACRARHVHGEQSDEVLDLRMACLDKNLVQLEALVTLFEAADEQVVTSAVTAAATLPSHLRCADVVALKAELPLPDNDQVSEQIKGARATLARAKALNDAGKYAAALAICEELRPQVQQLGYRPLQAETFLLTGQLYGRVSRLVEAENVLLEAVAAAEAGRADRQKARAWIELARIRGYDSADATQGKHATTMAYAALERLEMPGDLTATLAMAEGAAAYRRGAYTEAQEHFTAARDQLRVTSGGDSVEVAAAVSNIGIAYQGQGQYARALEQYRQALPIFEEQLGAVHPKVGMLLNSIAVALKSLGDNQQALDYFTRSLAISEQLLGPEHLQVAMILNNMGVTMRDLGEPAEALGHYERALRIRRTQLPESHPDIPSVMANMATAYDDLGNTSKAMALYRRAIELEENAAGSHHPALAQSISNFAGTLRAHGELVEAKAMYQRALAIWEQSLGPDHPSLALALTGLGKVHLDEGRPLSAIAPLERALGLRRQHEVEPALLARTRIALARALWDSGNNKQRARELAELARDGLMQAGDGYKLELAEVTRWIAELR